MDGNLPENDVVLWGIGHTNAHLLRMWGMNPIPKTRLTCLSNYSIATYSGMLSGVLAGQYQPAEMEIDLVKLTAWANARLILDPVTGLDLSRREVLFEDRTPIPFEALCIGIGSVPDMQGVRVSGGRLLPIKPMQTFLTRLDDALRDAETRHRDRALHLMVVGGGVAGVEVSLCLRRRLDQQFPNREISLCLIQSEDVLMPGTGKRLRARAQAALVQAGVNCYCGQRVIEIDEESVVSHSGTRYPADVVIWATGARGPDVLQRLGLLTDDRGFLVTDQNLQVISGEPIFVVGDSGTPLQSRFAKAGVYAVRQGPVVRKNVEFLLAGERLKPFRPQSSFLKLMNLGDGRAIGEYRGISLGGRWAWRLKDRIDRAFMRKYQEPPATGAMGNGSDSDEMRCLGCGGKVAGSLLHSVLGNLESPQSDWVIHGVQSVEDGAVLNLPESTRQVMTTDFFAAPFDDAYLSGRVAAIHAMSDAFAMGAQARVAQAIVCIPEGPSEKQRQTLHEVLAGAAKEFHKAQVTLVGGQTIEGPRLEIGFTILASCEQAPFLKSNARPGDQLFLTKRLGTGVLMAAARQGKCEADWWEALLEEMLEPQHPLIAGARRCGVTAATDITGFGLAGHLLELLNASETGATLRLAALPELPGALELLDDGLRSSLDHANRHVMSNIRAEGHVVATARFQLLFDPQTCGGFLFCVSSDSADAFVAQCESSGARVWNVGAVHAVEEVAHFSPLVVER